MNLETPGYDYQATLDIDRAANQAILHWRANGQTHTAVIPMPVAIAAAVHILEIVERVEQQLAEDAWLAQQQQRKGARDAR
jgi:hypothetical protein